MIARSVVLALLGRYAAATANGHAGCQCIGGLPAAIERVNCTDDAGNTPSWADDVVSSCVVATDLNVDSSYPGTVGGHPLYPADYGKQCEYQVEPGAAACFHLENATYKADQAADWCGESGNDWCYVDACECDFQVFESTYFPGDSIYYNYDTCGTDGDPYTTADLNNMPDDLVEKCGWTTTGATRASMPALVVSLASLLAYAAL